MAECYCPRCGSDDMEWVVIIDRETGAHTVRDAPAPWWVYFVPVAAVAAGAALALGVL